MSGSTQSVTAMATRADVATIHFFEFIFNLNLQT